MLQQSEGAAVCQELGALAWTTHHHHHGGSLQLHFDYQHCGEWFRLRAFTTTVFLGA